ncbi:MAG: hypothetical protein IKH82_03835 [Clostridiales bacterium]|nr:hypothetical protein [Clostridiales bacterium]
MRLIDKKELKEWIESWFTKNKYYHPYSKSNNIPIDELYDILEQLPTIDAEPVRHGKWIFTNKPNIYGGTSIKCSECGYEGMVAHVEDHHYCWVCGSRNDGEGEES